MKFTLNWLKEHLDTDASLQQILDTLTAIGLEVEEVKNPAEDLKNFVVGHVVEHGKHPDADKLSVCKVDTGDEIHDVVCGAPNVRQGLKICFAPVGTYVPGVDFTLKKAKIRGQASNGMICSEKELELSDEHNGIMELDPDATVGQSFVDYYGLDDPMIDIAITPNRGDCLGVRGVARDLAAAGLGTLKPLARSEAVKGLFESEQKVVIDDNPVCPVFRGRTVRGVKNGPSPAWMQQRLKAIGLRPISALVDITNYVSFDLGRPLHVYDIAKVNGPIRPRMATAEDGEFAALNDKSYTPTVDDCVISDDKGVLGFGGIVGGEESGCTETTTDVFIECAWFDPISIAKTGRRHQIDSDARYRFERGVDPESVELGMEAATHWVMELCGGEPSGVVIAGEAPNGRKTWDFRPARVRELGGVDVSAEECTTILEKLGFAVSGSGDTLQVESPSYRPDVTVGEADFVEEILRIHGLDNVPSTPLRSLEAVARPVLTVMQKRVRNGRRMLASRGLVETVNYSFVSRKEAELFGGGQAELTLANPISSDLDVMRPSVLVPLVAAASRNGKRGFRDFGLFELGPDYQNDTPKGQRTVAAGIRCGQNQGDHWAGGRRPVDAYDARADALAVLAEIGAPVDNLKVVTNDLAPWYHPGRAGKLVMGKMVLAQFGELHPATIKAMDAEDVGPIAAFEVFFDVVPQPKAKKGAKRTRARLDISDYQAVDRDFAFIVDQDVQADEILRAAKGADKKLVKGVTLFDVYQGKGVEDGKKSLALRVTLQSSDDTLTDKQIDAVADQVVANVAKQGGVLRG